PVPGPPAGGARQPRALPHLAPGAAAEGHRPAWLRHGSCRSGRLIARTRQPRLPTVPNDHLWKGTLIMTNRRRLITPASRSRRSTLSRRSALMGGAGLLGLGLAACGSDDSGSGGGGGTITLGYIPSWTAGLSTAYLLDNRLTAMGYDVEHEEISEAGVLYAGLAQGDVDMYPSAWPEVTHASYMEEYGDSIEDLIGYYEGAVLNLSVPEYVDIDSIEDLVGQADRFGNRIVG